MDPSVLTLVFVLLTGLVAGTGVGFALGATRSRHIWRQLTQGKSIITGADFAYLMGCVTLARRGFETVSLDAATQALDSLAARLESFPLAGSYPKSEPFPETRRPLAGDLGL